METEEQRQIIGEHGTLENKFSIMGEQGNKPIYFRGTREQVPPPPRRASLITILAEYICLQISIICNRKSMDQPVMLN